MNAKTILFPTDFSSLSDTALEYAASLAKDAGAKLLIVHVKEPPVSYVGDMYYGPFEPDKYELTKMLARVVPEDSSIACEHRLRSGNPADEIIDLANEANADLIVMATHGRSGLTHLLMGSVAEAVVRKANCPVLTFKPRQVAPAKAK